MRLCIPVATFALIIGSATTSGAQTTAAPAHHPRKSDDPVVKAITDAENRWIRAFPKGDVRALDAVLAPTYSDTDEEGSHTTKQDILAAVRSGAVKFDSISFDKLDVQQYGNTAVATGIAEQKGAYKGQPFAPKVAFTDTFVRLNGVWRAVASQRTAVH